MPKVAGTGDKLFKELFCLDKNLLEVLSRENGDGINKENLAIKYPCFPDPDPDVGRKWSTGNALLSGWFGG